jgi:hypothetical protein
MRGIKVVRAINLPAMAQEQELATRTHSQAVAHTVPVKILQQLLLLPEHLILLLVSPIRLPMERLSRASS